MRQTRTLAAILIVALLVAPTAFARRRAVRSPSESLVTFEISLPPAERLATGIGLGVLYDPTILQLVDITNAAPDVFHLSKAPELVEDPPRLPGQTAMLRLTWVSPAGQWSPALGGGSLAQLQFARLSAVDTQIRVVSLTADASHAIQPMTMRIAADAEVTSCSLDPQEVETTRICVSTA